jgi:hypothetical protein
MIFNNVIGVGGLAGSGKDTFVNLLQSHIPNIQRFALADSLKSELNPTLVQLYGTDIFTCSREQKDIVRPVLVAHGKVRRTLSKGRHWIDILNNKISSHKQTNPNDVICITDVRYDVFHNDEVNWLQKELGGIFVHVSRFEQQDGGQRLFQTPPNADEAENDPKLKVKADYRVIWPSANKVDGSPDFSSLNIYVEEFVKWLRR